MMEQYVPMVACLADQIIGDPRSKYHPVVLIGNLIALLERLLLKPSHSRKHKKLAGAMLVLIVLSIVYLITWLVEYFILQLSPMLGYICIAIFLSFAISPKSLAAAGREIQTLLIQGDLVQARSKVGWIVGRDTENLNVSEVTRATVETVAENIVDGIISPLIYFIIGGLPLAYLYRAVNTLDSMVGYKNEKYLDFGMVAARVDDVFNYIPARLTAVFLVIAAIISGYNALGAVRIIRRDAAKHPSPNSGLPEAAVAGALGIQLGGLNYYGGVPSFRACMGDAQQQVMPCHIGATIKLMYIVTGLMVFCVTIIWGRF